MPSFSLNEWIVGIGGGIISGFIVFFITNWMGKRANNSKYLEQISHANSDIIYVLKPYVAEKGLPEKEIVDAVIVSTARKYKVKSEELYSIRIICEELIREIIENAYVSCEKKQEYSLQLMDYLHTLEKDNLKSFLISDIKKELKNTDNFSESNYRERITTTISTVLSIFAGIIGTLSCLLFDVEDLSSISEIVINNHIPFLFFALFITIIFIAAILLLFLAIIMENKVKKKLKKKDQRDK